MASVFIPMLTGDRFMTDGGAGRGYFGDEEFWGSSTPVGRHVIDSFYDDDMTFSSRQVER